MRQVRRLRRAQRPQSSHLPRSRLISPDLARSRPISPDLARSPVGSSGGSLADSELSVISRDGARDGARNGAHGGALHLELAPSSSDLTAISEGDHESRSGCGGYSSGAVASASVSTSAVASAPTSVSSYASASASTSSSKASFAAVSSVSPPATVCAARSTSSTSSAQSSTARDPPLSAGLPRPTQLRLPASASDTALPATALSKQPRAFSYRAPSAAREADARAAELGAVSGAIAGAVAGAALGPRPSSEPAGLGGGASAAAGVEAIRRDQSAPVGVERSSTAPLRGRCASPQTAASPR